MYPKWGFKKEGRIGSSGYTSGKFLPQPVGRKTGKKLNPKTGKILRIFVPALMMPQALALGPGSQSDHRRGGQPPPQLSES